MNGLEMAESRSGTVDKLATAVFVLCALAITTIGVAIVFDLFRAGLQLARGLDPLEGSGLVTVGSWVRELILPHAGA